MLRNEIYSKTGRRRLGSLFPLYFTRSQLGFVAGAGDAVSALFILRRRIFCKNLFKAFSRFALVYEK
jgi:hypothetical protein